MTHEQLKATLDTSIGTSCHEQLYQSIQTRIRDGTIKPGTPFPSEHRIMEALDITRTVLRQAFDQLEREGLVNRRHGVGTFVSQPSLWRTLGKVTNIGIVVWSDPLDQKGKDSLGYLCSEAVAAGLQVNTIHAQHDNEQVLDAQMSGMKLTGLIVMPTPTKRAFDQVARFSLPKVVLEMRAPQDGLDHVVIDSYPAVYDGVSKLIELGHRDLAYIGGLIFDRDASLGGEKRYIMAQDSDSRRHAFRRALEDHALQYRPELSFELPYEDSDVNTWVLDQKKCGKFPSAIVVFSDSLAIRVVRACRANGLHIPADVSVMGFGNSIPESRRGELATGVFSYQEMARLAVQRIHERINQGGMSGVVLSVRSRFKSGWSIAKVSRKR